MGEKKTVERERDEAIAVNVALVSEAENHRGGKERCEKLNQTLEFEIHRLLKERTNLKTSLEGHQKEVDDLKKKNQDAISEMSEQVSPPSLPSTTLH